MNPKLEKASWIAAIISALVALYIILPATHLSKFAQSRSQGKDAPFSMQARKIDKQPPPEQVITYADIRVPPPCEENANLLEAIKTAGTIYSTTDRDNVYTSLVHDALCAKKFDVAIDTASNIYTTTIRDNCYYRSVEFLILKGNMDYANRFAGRIYTTSLRDKAKQVIIVGMKKRKGKQSNPADAKQPHN